MNTYILVRTDGYEITIVIQDSSREHVEEIMRKDYERHIPAEWIPEYRQSSSLENDRAILYSNGEDVFVWKIIKAAAIS